MRDACLLGHVTHQIGNRGSLWGTEQTCEGATGNFNFHTTRLSYYLKLFNGTCICCLILQMPSLKETESNYTESRFYTALFVFNHHPVPQCCIKLQSVQYTLLCPVLPFLVILPIPGYNALSALCRPAAQWSFPTQ